MLIRVDHKLRIALSELPADVLHSIEEALSIPNLERQKQMEQGIYGWQGLPEFVKLWELDAPDGKMNSAELVMPRGFLPSLVQGFDDLEIRWDIDDQRFFDYTPSDMGEKISLHSWQHPAVEALKIHQQGIWKAPPGSGKTVAVLDLIRRVNTPSLVLVNTKDILYQWQNRARAFLGEDFPVSTIGDGKVQISDYLTIATIQTLHSRFDEFERTGFFDDTFGLVCLDECHHATAETYNKIVNRFTSRFRIGVSATPDKTGDFELSKAVLGPIVHETPPEKVDSIIKPHVFKIVTNFDFPYVGKKGSRPSNYPQLLKSLVSNPERNYLITKAIMMNPGSRALVVSKRLEHFDILIDMLQRSGYPYNIWRLTGAESTAERKFIANEAVLKPCVIFSTLADEALDIPRLDSIFLIYPQRNPGLIEQQIGRVCRNHPAKQGASVYDFADVNCGPLEAQYRVRRNQVYMANGLDISVVSAQQIYDYKLDNDEFEYF